MVVILVRVVQHARLSSITSLLSIQTEEEEEKVKRRRRLYLPFQCMLLLVQHRVPRQYLLLQVMVAIRATTCIDDNPFPS